MAAYDAAMKGELREATPVGVKRAPPGSLSNLIASYYGSTAFDGLEPSTKRTYRASLEPLREKFGQLSVRTMQTKHVEAMVRGLSDRPASANKLLKRLKTLMELAVRMGWRTDNPAAPVRPYRIKSDGFHAWTEQEIEAFKARYPSGTRERLALALLLSTGQRGSDVVKMGAPAIVRLNDGTQAIKLRQQKTRTELIIPVLPELAAELSINRGPHLVFLTTAYGKPFSIKGFQQWFAARAKLATGNPKCTAHGLRKACAVRLAEAGATPHQIQAITGHKSLSEVQLYTAARDQARLAQSAFGLLSGGTSNEHAVSNPSERLDNIASIALKEKEN
jgi:site-specific recombinase XerD